MRVFAESRYDLLFRKDSGQVYLPPAAPQATRAGMADFIGIMSLWIVYAASAILPAINPIFLIRA
jgi:hypothetical protein